MSARVCVYSDCEVVAYISRKAATTRTSGQDPLWEWVGPRAIRMRQSKRQPTVAIRTVWQARQCPDVPRELGGPGFRTLQFNS